MTNSRLIEIDRRARTVTPGIFGNGPEASKLGGFVESFDGSLSDADVAHILHSLQIKTLVYGPDCTYSVVSGGGRVLTRFTASQIPAHLVDSVRDAYRSEGNQRNIASLPQTIDARVASVDEAVRLHNSQYAPRNLVHGVDYHSED